MKDGIDPLPGLVRGIDILDARGSLHHFDDRPERDALAVGETTAPENEGLAF